MRQTALSLFPLAAIPFCACDRAAEPTAPDAPRPVSVVELGAAASAGADLRTGLVQSWKTEKLEFEVSGRVLWVLEPGNEVKMPIYGKDNTVLQEGTVLGKLDSARLRLNVDSAKAQVKSVEQRKAAAQVELETGIPARVASAESAVKLAQVQYNRYRQLAQRNAGSRENLDKAAAELRSAQASLRAEQAALKSQGAQVLSLEADINKAKQALAEAERNLADATLYSAYQGEVTETHVVPGSYVSPGEPALTVQMTNPIKIVLEVSAAESRRLRQRDQVRFKPRGEQGAAWADGVIYTIDNVADPKTRTFTVTILTRNRKTRMAAPASMGGKPVARTATLFPMRLEFVPGAQGLALVEQKSIRRDDQGTFLWVVTNREVGRVDPDASPVLKVRKVRVIEGEARYPYLGNVVFVPVTFPKGTEIDPDKAVVAGELEVSDGEPDGWDGAEMLLDRSRWGLRPGDLVDVDLFARAAAPDGFAVPTRSVVESAGKYHVFAVDRTGRTAVAKRVPVTLLDENDAFGATTVRRIRPADGGSLTAGAEVVVRGAQYLQDGEKVRAIRGEDQ